VVLHHALSVGGTPPAELRGRPWFRPPGLAAVRRWRICCTMAPRRASTFWRRRSPPRLLELNHQQCRGQAGCDCRGLASSTLPPKATLEGMLHSESPHPLPRRSLGGAPERRLPVASRPAPRRRRSATSAPSATDTTLQKYSWRTGLSTSLCATLSLESYKIFAFTGTFGSGDSPILGGARRHAAVHAARRRSTRERCAVEHVPDRFALGLRPSAIASRIACERAGRNDLGTPMARSAVPCAARVFRDLEPREPQMSFAQCSAPAGAG
jgi:hypothetical protein